MSKTLSDLLILRYNRQIVLPQIDLEGQERLLNSSILVVGVGGLGSAASQYLVATGIGHITLVDDDRVELSNLHRQVVHSEEDINQLKVASAKSSLSQLNSECNIETIEHRLSDLELHDLAKKHDIMLDCSDNFETRRQINRIAYQLNKPLISAAAIRFEGNLFAINPSEGKACYQCLSSLFSEQPLSCTETGILSPVVGIIGTAQALLVIKALIGLGDIKWGQLQMFDAISMVWTDIKVSKISECPVCNHSSQ